MPKMDLIVSLCASCQIRCINICPFRIYCSAPRIGIIEPFPFYTKVNSQIFKCTKEPTDFVRLLQAIILIVKYRKTNVRSALHIMN